MLQAALSICGQGISFERFTSAVLCCVFRKLYCDDGRLMKARMCLQRGGVCRGFERGAGPSAALHRRRLRRPRVCACGFGRAEPPTGGASTQCPQFQHSNKTREAKVFTQVPHIMRCCCCLRCCCCCCWWSPLVEKREGGARCQKGVGIHHQGHRRGGLNHNGWKRTASRCKTPTQAGGAAAGALKRRREHKKRRGGRKAQGGWGRSSYACTLFWWWCGGVGGEGNKSEERGSKTRRGVIVSSGRRGDGGTARATPSRAPGDAKGEGDRVVPRAPRAPRWGPRMVFQRCPPDAAGRPAPRGAPRGARVGTAARARTALLFGVYEMVVRAAKGSVGKKRGLSG